METKKPTVNDIVCIHEQFVLEYYESLLPKVLNESDLRLTVARAEITHTLDECAAAYLYNLARLNTFAFGNCATAILTADLTYKLNGYSIVANPYVDDLDTDSAGGSDHPNSQSVITSHKKTPFHVLVRLARRDQIDQAGVASWLRQYRRGLESGFYLD